MSRTPRRRIASAGERHARHRLHLALRGRGRAPRRQGADRVRAHLRDWGGVGRPLVFGRGRASRATMSAGFGPHVPLIMFRAHVRAGIDPRSCSGASVPKTALQLLACRRSASRESTTASASPPSRPRVAVSPPPAFRARMRIPPPRTPTRAAPAATAAAICAPTGPPGRRHPRRVATAFRVHVAGPVRASSLDRLLVGQCRA